MKEAIKKLEEEKTRLEAQLTEVNRIMNDLKDYIQRHPEVSDPPFKLKEGTDQSPRRLPADSKNKVPAALVGMDIQEKLEKKKKKLKVTKSNRGRHERKNKKWNKIVFDFIRDNVNLPRKELVEKVNLKFGLNTTYGSLAFYMSKEGIKKKERKKAREPDMRKYASGRKKKGRAEEKPMSDKEINKSLKDMHAEDPEDDDPIDLFSDDEGEE